MTTTPTVRELARQLDDLRARIPDHLLLPHPLNGKAPPHIHELAKAAQLSEADAPAYPLTWPTGFGPYAWCGSPMYGHTTDGRPCWDQDILGSFYNDKDTFLIWTLRFFAPGVPMQVLRVRNAVQHGGAGMGEGARFLFGFGSSGGWIQMISGFEAPLGDEHVNAALTLPETLLALNEQIANLEKRVKELETGGK